MNTIIKYILIAAMSLTSLGLAAKTPHEISVNVGGGLSSLNAKTNNLKIGNNDKLGVKFGVGYAYNFSPSFALVSGVDIALNKGDLKMSEFEGSYLETDSEGDIFKFVYKGNGYSEKVKTTYLHIPLMARYTYNVNDKVGIYLAGGAKVGFKLSAKYDNKISSVTTEGGYFNLAGSGDDIPSIGDIPTEGLGTLENVDSKGDIKMKTQMSAAIELGMRYELSPKNALYFGAYFDHALNNILDKSGKNFIGYNHNTDSKTILNSMTDSYHTQSNKPLGSISALRPMNVGLKVQFAFKL